MDVSYRQSFLRDLKKLKRQPIYQEVYTLAFTTLPQVKTLQEIPNLEALTGHAKRYRVRLGEYRVGLQVEGSAIQVMRVLHRREFYRYFP